MAISIGPGSAALAPPSPAVIMHQYWIAAVDSVRGWGRYSPNVQQPTRESVDLSPQPHEDTKAWFSRVVDSHYRFFFSTAIKILRRRQLAEDAVQTGVLKALKKLDHLEEPRAVVGWINQIVRNTALDMIRKNKRVSPADPDGLAQTPAKADDDPLQGDQMAIILEELDDLPESQAEVVTLRHVQGLNVTELAERLGITANAARVRLFRAYERLRSNPRVRRACGMEDES